jgi:hypothetical protein
VPTVVYSRSSSCGAETSVKQDPLVGRSELIQRGRLIFTIPNPD